MTLRITAGLLLFGFARVGVAAPPMGLSVGGPAKPTTVVITAVTLADDCGGGGGAKADQGAGKREMSAKRACQQSSMQLSVNGGDGGAVQVKKVELVDDKGAVVGELKARAPTVWTEGGAYVPWDENVGAGQRLQVSYALSQPNWDAVPNRWNRRFTVRAVISIAGADQTAQKEVGVESLPTSLPANVKT